MGGVRTPGLDWILAGRAHQLYVLPRFLLDDVSLVTDGPYIFDSCLHLYKNTPLSPSDTSTPDIIIVDEL